jgi:peptidoglycan/LPS O-acetylase OafA/YrhL
MIQRQQTLWLLLATAAAVLTFMFPFATGEEMVVKTAMKKSVEVIAGDNFFTLLLTIASIGISAVTIFMFKDRKLQMRLCLLGILVSVLILVLYILNMRKLITSTPALWAILPVIVIASYIMAFRNIRKDEKLVKSLDKLR